MSKHFLLPCTVANNGDNNNIVYKQMLSNTTVSSFHYNDTCNAAVRHFCSVTRWLSGQNDAHATRSRTVHTHAAQLTHRLAQDISPHHFPGLIAGSVADVLGDVPSYTHDTAQLWLSNISGSGQQS